MLLEELVEPVYGEDELAGVVAGPTFESVGHDERNVRL